MFRNSSEVFWRSESSVLPFWSILIMCIQLASVQPSSCHKLPNDVAHIIEGGVIEAFLGCVGQGFDTSFVLANGRRGPQFAKDRPPPAGLNAARRLAAGC